MDKAISNRYDRRKKTMISPSCLYCQHALDEILDLGNIPLVNYFPHPDDSPLPTYPLRLCICPRCALLQIDHRVDPQDIFPLYHYKSGASRSLIHHLHTLASSSIHTYGLSSSSKVLDIGCNDGTFLDACRRHGVHTYGIDPSLITTDAPHVLIKDFFSQKKASHLRSTYGTFDLITLSHTLANMPHLSDICEGIRTLLSPTGVALIEVASSDYMLQTGCFDVIYHEHYSYFSPHVLSAILAHHGLYTRDISYHPIQGESFRLHITHKKPSDTPYKTPQVPWKTLERFQKTTKAWKKHFSDILGRYPEQKLSGWGAPAKSVTLIHTCNISSRIARIFDTTGEKQGKVLPGTSIPIQHPKTIHRHSPSPLILFSWNYVTESMEMIQRVMPSTPAIIIPFPTLQVRE